MASTFTVGRAVLVRMGFGSWVSATVVETHGGHGVTVETGDRRRIAIHPSVYRRDLRIARTAAAVAFLLLPLLGAAACGASPTAPTVAQSAPAPALREMDFDINIPDIGVAASLKATYPNGVRMSPVAAQTAWDYTRAYGGSPNVYYGETSPCHEYVRAGIVVAPLHVATLAQFTSADWSVAEPGFTYAWVGRFVFTEAARPGTYVADVSCAPK